MPELPEVETIRCGLEKILQDRLRLVGVKKLSKALRQPLPRTIVSRLREKTLKSIERRGKYLLWFFEGKSNSEVLLNHLGMTGSWRVDSRFSRVHHDHFVLQFDRPGRGQKKNPLTLVYRDPRRFGVIDLVRKNELGLHRLLSHLGPDPFMAEFSAQYLKTHSRNRRIQLKPFIMDQRLVVGVGNIYASEALFRSGLRPTKRVSYLTIGQCQVLVENIQQVLREAIDAGGSTISDFRQAEGSKGSFQNTFAVYGREDEPCVKCGSSIKALVQNQRRGFYCNRCQR